MRDGGLRIPHPLVSAEIETNAPYQPFHADRRVTIALFPGDRSTGSSYFPSSPGSQPNQSSDEKWVFGQEICSEKQRITQPFRPLGEEDSVIYRETNITSTASNLVSMPISILEDRISPVVSSTKKKSKKNRLPARTFEDTDAGERVASLATHGLDPNDDLLEGDSPS